MKSSDLFFSCVDTYTNLYVYILHAYKHILKRTHALNVSILRACLTSLLNTHLLTDR